MNVIYEPSGKAKEYADLAVNLYKGCTHGCRYCFGAKTPWVSADDYYKTANPKKDVISKLQKDCRKLNGDIPEILLSFVGDVYQHAEMDLGLTRQAIKILIENNLPFTVLTKGGTRAVRDFDLLEEYDRGRFGTTLVFTEQKDADHWEPGAATITDRIKAIQTAYDRGIKTWVSLEPVIDPDQALQIIRDLHPIVEHWKVGKVNYHETSVDWIFFREEVKDLFNDLGADYYLKNSLTKL
ncbi:MAG: radical SAM protein [Pseudomonadota bacterium]